MPKSVSIGDVLKAGKLCVPKPETQSKLILWFFYSFIFGLKKRNSCLEFKGKSLQKEDFGRHIKHTLLKMGSTHYG